MAIPTHDNVRQLPDFAPLVKWEISIINPPTGLIVPPNLNFQCTTAQVPKTEANQKQDVVVRGHRVYQQSLQHAEGTIQLDFVETVDNAISQFIRSWRELCWATNTGVQGERNAVEATIQMLRMNRQNVPIWEYRLIGCFLEDYDPLGGQLESDNPDVARPTMTISYDKFFDGEVGSIGG